MPQSFPPYYQLDKHGRASGFAIEVFDNVAGMAGYRVRYQIEQTWPEVYDELRSGHADVIPNLGITVARQEWADFTRPVETFAIAIFVRESTRDIAALEDLQDRRVATVAGNVAVKLLEGHPGVQVVVYDQPELALFALLSAEVDAYVYPEPTVWELAVAAGVDEKIRRVGQPLTEIKRGIAVSKGALELQQNLDQAAQVFLAGEVYRDIYKRWFGTPQPFWTIARVAYLASVIVALSLVMSFVVMAIWRNRSLRRMNMELEGQVEERTRLIERHAALLEAANQDLEAFAYSVSHDLRAPLRAIDGFSQILLEDYAAKLDDEGKRLFQVVRDNANRMGVLIDDILRFSRAGRLELALVEVDMNGLAREAWDELAASRGTRNIDFTLHPLPTACADRAAIGQVLTNLLGNALKFSAGADPALIEVGGREEENEIIYYVKDNGAGFDMAYAGKLFGVFQRLHGQDEFEGTGIGLAIVKRILDKHGGRVWAEGQVGGGAVFHFALPRCEPCEGETS